MPHLKKNKNVLLAELDTFFALEFKMFPENLSKYFVQGSLCVLNINNNNIDELRDLAVLNELQHFSAADNKLHNMEVSVTSAHSNIQLCFFVFVK